MLGQFRLAFATSASALLPAWAVAIESALTRALVLHEECSPPAVIPRAMRWFGKEPVDIPDLLGIAVRGRKKDVDRATAGLSLHR